MSSDDRSWLMRSVMSMDQAASVPYFYPRLFSLVCLIHTVKLLTSHFLHVLLTLLNVFPFGLTLFSKVTEPIERPVRLHEKLITLIKQLIEWQ